MGQHESKDFTFDVPDEWSDRSVIAYAAPVEGTTQSSLIVAVTHELPSPGETLKTFAARQVTDLGRKLKDFALKDTRAGLVSGSPAVMLEYTWTAPNTALAQVIAMVEHQHKFLVFTFTMPIADAPAMREKSASATGLKEAIVRVIIYLTHQAFMIREVCKWR